MSLIGDDTLESFVQQQKEKVQKEIQHWNQFRKDNPEGCFYPFTNHRREGQHFVKNNRLKEDDEQALREYINLPDVVEIDGILVDLTSINIPYNCMHKSCKLTGHYCCRVTTCTAHTETSASIMQEAGREYIDKYQEEDRKARIRRGDTHTDKLNMNAQHEGHCVFGEEQQDTDPETGQEHDHIHCNLHEAAYEQGFPLHYAHSIGSSLFPADILIVDGKWFVTAASSRAKERRVTRWYVTSDNTICTNHGDSSGLGILQHPDYDSMYADILGRATLDSIQSEAYGETGPVDPEITDGWIHAEERGLESYEEECRNCDGNGCDYCDGRGFFRNWK